MTPEAAATSASDVLTAFAIELVSAGVDLFHLAEDTGGAFVHLGVGLAKVLFGFGG